MITGGSSGLDQAIAVGYAQCDVTVVVSDINEDGATEAVATIAEQGGSARAVSLDATKRGRCVGVAVRRERERVANDKMLFGAVF